MTTNSNTVAGIEPVIDEIELLPGTASLKTAPSLKPGLAMMEAAATGNEEACAIRDAWKFRGHPIRVVSPAEFEQMAERGLVVFRG